MSEKLQDRFMVYGKRDQYLNMIESTFHVFLKYNCVFLKHQDVLGKHVMMLVLTKT